MPIRRGYVGVSTESWNFTPGLTNDLDAYNEEFFPPSFADIGPLRGANIRLPQLPVKSFATAKPGYRLLSYFNDFYERIHITPLTIDFGNIVPPQTQPVEVWNAFLSPKPLTSIAASGTAGGLSFAPAPPMTFQPLQSVTFTLTATADVSPTVDAIFDFLWTGADSAPVHVIGIAVIPVPWKQLVPMAETLTWATDVMTALDGTEQAISLRDIPRQVYAITLQPDDYTGAQHAFVSGYGRGFAVPSMDEGQPCSVGKGATEILIDTTQGDWREMVMIWAGETDYEIIEIDTTLPDRLVLKRPTTGSRRGKAYPTAAARLTADPRRTTYGRIGGTIEATFQFTSGTDLAGPAATVQWNGYDVLLQAPLLYPVDDTHSQRIEALDNVTGWVEDDRYWGRTKPARPMRWVVNRTELWQLRRWLHRRRGQLRPFYHPSFEADFTVAATGVVAAQLIVRANGFERYGKAKSLAIRVGGIYVFADILGVTDSGSGTIGLQLSRTFSFTHADVQRISIMSLKRLAADSVLINHLGGGRAEVLADFLEF